MVSVLKIRDISAAGVFTGLTVVILTVASLTPVSKLAFCAVASLVIEFVFLEYGKKTACISFTAVSLISVLLLPQKSIGIIFISVFGGYVTIRNLLVFKKKAISYFVKLLYLNLSVYLLYILGLLVVEGLAEKVKITDLPSWQIVVGIFVIQLVFIAYDYALTLGGRVLTEYYGKIKGEK